MCAITSQYWTNLENRRATWDRPPIDTWDRMKEKLETKYVPLSFSARLMNSWQQHTQGNNSAKVYVKKFNEFLIRENTLHKEGEAQILSRFRASLKDDLQTELLARWVTELEAVYILVQNLDSARTNHPSKSHDYKASVSKPSPPSQPHRSSTQTLSHRDDIKGRVLNGTTETRALIPL